MPTLEHLLLLLKMNHIRAKAGNNREQVRNINLFAIAVYNSALHWKPRKMICHTGNIDMTQCMIYFTNEKVSRKKKCSILFICVNVQSNWHIEAWVSTQASFINSPPHPPLVSTQRTLSQPLFYEETFYIAMCLQHMGPPLSYVPLPSTSKAKPLSLTCWDWA